MGGRDGRSGFVVGKGAGKSSDAGGSGKRDAGRDAGPGEKADRPGNHNHAAGKNGAYSAAGNGAARKASQFQPPAAVRSSLGVSSRISGEAAGSGAPIFSPKALFSGVSRCSN